MKVIFLIFSLTFTLNVSAQDSTKVDRFQKTDEVLAEIVKKAIVLAEKTGEFVITQAPLLLQEFYRWHIAKYILLALIWFVIFLLVQKLSLLFSYRHEDLIPQGKKEYYVKQRDGRFHFSDPRYGDTDAYVSSVCIRVASFFFLIGVAVSLYKLVFILVAPKLYLIEYFLK